MLYDANNPIDVQRAKTKFDAIIESKSVFELTEKKMKSYSQNNYAHLIIGYLALELGEERDYVKQNYFKKAANKDLFVETRYDERTKQNYEVVRSFSKLNSEETTLAIDRFRTFASKVCGVYLPEPNEDEFLKHITLELERQKRYIR